MVIFCVRCIISKVVGINGLYGWVRGNVLFLFVLFYGGLIFFIGKLEVANCGLITLL